MRPLLPSFDKLAPYATLMDQARWYSNGGPLHERFRQRLTAHFALPEGCLGLANSGTSALIGLILALAGRAGPQRPLAICPSYTFAATGCAALAAGYTPCFADIAPGSWALDPAQVLAMPELSRAGVILVVAPYGRMVELSGWAAFAEATGLPVVVDAAACFDTLDIPALSRCGERVAVALSLHATKTLSAAEGGVMLCADPVVMRRAEAALTFGFDGGRVSLLPGTNGKLSEYHAMVGLAELDGWTAKRAAFLAVARHYEAAAERHGLAGRILVNPRHAVPYAHLLARDAAEAEAVMAALSRARIESRRWYEFGLHRQPAFQDCPRGPLPVTEALAARLVGLPFAVDLEARVVERIVALVARALAQG